MIALFGSPFFVAGVCMLLGATGIVPGYTESGEHAAPVILGPMGFVFLAVGGVMVFGRQWLILDLGRGSLLRQTGLLVPLWTNERPLSEFNAVVLAHDPGGSDSAESYPVKLRGSVGEDIKIVDPSQFTESLRMAEYLAKTLRLPLIDSTTGHETVVSPDHTGESLRDRLSRGPMPAPPRRPSTMRSVVVEIAGETSISIPGGNPTQVGNIRVLLPIAIFLIAMLFAIPVLARSAQPLRLFAILILVFGLPTAYASVTFVISGKRRKTNVTASPCGLVIVRPRSRKIETTVIPAEDVLDVDYSTFEDAIASARRSAYPAGQQIPQSERAMTILKKLVPNPGIIVKARSGLVTLGEGLSSDELQYLVWLLRRALTG